MSNQAVATRKKAASKAVTQMATQSAQLMDNVINLASNGDFDIGKLERLIELYNKQQATIAQQEYSAAMARVQGKLEVVKADLYNDETKSWYASMEAMIDECRKVYSEEGFSLEVDTELVFYNETPYLKVIGTLSHSGGHSATKSIPIPADGKGAKGGAVMTRTHASVSALTYGRKSLVEMFFNLPVDKKHDDDGNAAGKRGLDPAKIKQLNDAIDQSAHKEAVYERIKKHYGVKDLSEIQEGDFNSVLIAINKIVRKEKEGGNENH